MSTDMTGTVVVYGASDDLIEIEGDVQGCDEYPQADGQFVLVGDGAQVRLRVSYTRAGIWAIAVAPVGEAMPMLPVTLTDGGYTPRATIEGVRLVFHEVIA
jgi:hypothetical protein